MSFLTTSSKINRPNNKENMLLASKEDAEDYNFKYVPENQFRHIVKDVQRQRCKDEEEHIWISFVKSQELTDTDIKQAPMGNIKDYLNASIEDVERELEKLEGDTFSKREKNCSNIPKQHKKSLVENGEDNISNATMRTQQNNIDDYNNGIESKRAFNVIRSSSDHMIGQKQQSKHFHTTYDYECSSDVELDTRHANDDDSFIDMQSNKLLAHKILVMQQKISKLLDEILFRLDSIPQPDGDIDLKRRQKRVMEFTIRLSRNYLYELNRYMADIRKHVRVISTLAKIKATRKSILFHKHEIERKLIATHQLLLHALSAYYKHIPCSVLNGHTEKFKEILQIVIDLKKICDEIQLGINYFGSGDTCVLPLEKETQEKCDAILFKLKSGSDNELRYDKRKKHLAAEVASNSSHKKKCTKHKYLVNRLSMYKRDINSSKGNFKKKPGHCNHKRKRHNMLENRVIADNYLSTAEYSNSDIITCTSSKEITKNTIKCKVYTKEDDIKTMMDTVPINSDNDRDDDEVMSKEELRLFGLTSDKLYDKKYLRIKNRMKEINTMYNDRNMKGEVTPVAEDLSGLVPIVADLMSVVTNESHKSKSPSQPPLSDSIATFLTHLQKYQSCKNSNNCALNADSVKTKISMESKDEYVHSKSSLNKPQRNSKNMHVIYMSRAEDSQELSQHFDISHKIACDNVNKTRNIGSALSSNEMINLIVSKETRSYLLHYKLEYQHLYGYDSMYSSNTRNKPWVIVAWIADKIINDLINEIAKELQIDDVIKKLFELEFQEF